MRDTPELTCQELVELVTDYLDGTMPPPEVARFDAHLVQCPPCRVYLEQVRQTVRALGQLPADAMPPSVVETLREHFRRWKAG